MTREEFEAVLAMEGLELRLTKQECWNQRANKWQRMWVAEIFPRGRYDACLPLYSWGVKRATALQRVIKEHIKNLPCA